MLRKAPPAEIGPRRSCTALSEAAPLAVGPTGTTGHARRAGATHAHLGTAGRGTRKGPWATSGPEELCDSERTYASTHVHRGTSGRRTRRWLLAASGTEELHGHKDVDVTK
jgi:hypothetical protein